MGHTDCVGWEGGTQGMCRWEGDNERKVHIDACKPTLLLTYIPILSSCSPFV